MTVTEKGTHLLLPLCHQWLARLGCNCHVYWWSDLLGCRWYCWLGKTQSFHWMLRKLSSCWSRHYRCRWLSVWWLMSLEGLSHRWSSHICQCWTQGCLDYVWQWCPHSALHTAGVGQSHRPWWLIWKRKMEKKVTVTLFFLFCSLDVKITWQWIKNRFLESGGWMKVKKIRINWILQMLTLNNIAIFFVEELVPHRAIIYLHWSNCYNQHDSTCILYIWKLHSYSE